ncbi:endoglucanase E-4-like isoform X2 [Vespula maculifrons]|uniref:Endoglucanase n=1 Tax=Vespula maculifrons TaxID=7453 RepID=A0ABD2CAE4_VESMC
MYMLLIQPKDEMSKLIRVRLNENVTTRENDLKSIKEWLIKQPHLPNVDDDAMLMTFLRGCKFSLEKCKKKLDMYFTMRAIVPEFFNNRDVTQPELKEILDLVNFPPLPGLTKDGCRVIVMRGKRKDMLTPNVSNLMKLVMMIGDVRLKEEIHGVAGDIYILDASVATPAHFAKFTPTIIKKFLVCIQEAYPVKLKQVHVVNISPLVDTIINFVKPFLKEKIRNRIFTHSNLEAIYEYIPKEILPIEYGGNAGSIQTIHDAWIKKLEEYGPWFAAQTSVVANETLRPGKPRTHDDIFDFIKIKRMPREHKKFDYLIKTISQNIYLTLSYATNLDMALTITSVASITKISATSATSVKPIEEGEEDYARVLELSLLFYEAQRSGKLPENNRISWRGDSALSDRGINGEDLTGGYYDAGDFVKFGFTMASTTTLLAWGAVSWPEAYIEAGQLDEIRKAIKWATDYFIKCHVSEFVFYGQVGDFSVDHTYWGRPEELNTTRPAYKIDPDHPGSDLAGETAAALAASSIVFKNVDPNYSERCLKHAKELYNFANKYRGLYHSAIRGAAQYYESTDYGDELAWAAAWLFKATNDSRYLEDAEHHYQHFHLKERPNEFFYNKKVAGVQVLLAQLTGQPEYQNAACAFCDFSVRQQKRTPKGLLYIDKFGTLCHAANVAFVCLQAADYPNIGDPQEYREFATQQISYMLGDRGRSYVVGYGYNPPAQPHHAASSCPNKPAPCGWPEFDRQEPNPQILYGALVSGPDEADKFQDHREEYIYTEVTLDYNAGFTSVLAGLLQLRIKKVE